jgi:GNAT superfamily N-acetyltransferase
MSATSELRPARETDIRRLMEIRAAVRENRLESLTLGADDYLPYIADARCWVWDEAGIVLGFAALDAASASVWALFVMPGSEGRGIGRALLAQTVAEARSRGLPALTLETASGTRAERVYRRGGWQGAGRGAKGTLRLRLPL